MASVGNDNRGSVARGAGAAQATKGRSDERGMGIFVGGGVARVWLSMVYGGIGFVL